MTSEERYVVLTREPYGGVGLGGTPAPLKTFGSAIKAITWAQRSYSRSDADWGVFTIFVNDSGKTYGVLSEKPFGSVFRYVPTFSDPIAALHYGTGKFPDSEPRAVLVSADPPSPPPNALDETLDDILQDIGAEDDPPDEMFVTLARVSTRPRASKKRGGSAMTSRPSCDDLLGLLG